ncbi:MAG: serine/threonine-protein kinase [Planctomycetia bacterium]|nr:serine/threonine-protein kinase [Planctomycetia bacterium]
MSMVTTSDEFLDHLLQSKLLSETQFDHALEVLAENEQTDANVSAKTLVQAKLITRLQAQRLLEGHARGFFISHYRIDEVLGSGGMGWVYIARDLETGEDVAMKMLCDQSETDAGLLTRFQLEAQAGLKLHHDSIVRTREIGKAAGVYGQVHFVVMDLVRGVGVDEFVAMVGSIPWQVSCHIVRHVAAGLHHAHRQGLVHRDIKPGNILVNQQCNAYVLDFGLSAASRSELGDEFSLSMIFGQDCLGTADYIAPEQARDSFQADRRADIYSLGATMYFMLCGHPLFPDCKTRPQKINAQWNIEPTPIRQLVPAVPEEVAQIVHRMLAKDREQRFSTAREVAELLLPFARPKRIDFNFQEILDRRALMARQRQKLLNEKSNRLAKATSLSVCTIDSKTMRPIQAQSETSIQKDTHLGDNRSKR